MPFVIDNSVVIGWHLSRWATAYSDAVLRALVNDNAHVPALWFWSFPASCAGHCLQSRSQKRGAEKACSCSKGWR